MSKKVSFCIRNEHIMDDIDHSKISIVLDLSWVIQVLDNWKFKGKQLISYSNYL